MRTAAPGIATSARFEVRCLMTKLQRQPFDAVCDHLARRRPPILRAWRKAAAADPDQRTARALTLSQFNDHIPEVLDAFELQLRSRPGGPAAATADRDQKKEEKKHGLHRWQQGYRLQELMSEWGHLQLCLFDELAAYAATHPGFTAANLVEVNRQMISMVNEAIRESAAQYERMQQAEAASHVGGLSKALERVQEIERARSVLIHQAVHDLSSNVFGVSLAANALGKTAVAETQRVEFAGILQQSVEGVTAMLSELMELARLEAGQEEREIAPFDVSALVNRLVTLNQGAARAGNLQLAAVGPRRLPVEGDAGKVGRLLQNLVGNAIKYTRQGGVHVSWGAEKSSWWLKVADTGPGLPSGAGAPLAASLKAATASARETDVKSAAATGEKSAVLQPAPGTPVPAQAAAAQPGEGIGLSIVKRLCELLDASLEAASSPETGTTFRVLFPRRYTAAPKRRKRKPSGK